jgi:hypothetical protein
LNPAIAVGDDRARDELGEFRHSARELGQWDMDRARHLPAFELLWLADIEQHGIAAVEELGRLCAGYVLDQREAALHEGPDEHAAG